MASLIALRRPPGRPRSALGLGVRRAIISACAMLAWFQAAGGEDTAPLEDAVKAAFIYKFAPFVTWPADKETAQQPFRICSFGSDRVTILLAQMTTGQNIGSRVIEVRAVQAPADLASCQILYIALSAPADDMWKAAKAKPILTVSQTPGAGIIQLVTVEHHVRFDVELAAANESGLSISSKLLGLARSVRGERKDRG